MLSEELSSHSTSDSRAGSYRDVPQSRTNDYAYQRRSSIIDDNEYQEPGNESDEQPKREIVPPRKEDQYIAALKYRFPTRSKTDYSYKQPINYGVPSAPPLPSSIPTTATATQTPTTSTATRSGAYQTTSRVTPAGISTGTGTGAGAGYGTGRVTTGTGTGNGNGNGNGYGTGRSATGLRSALRHVNPDDQNKYSKSIATQSTEHTTQPQSTSPRTNVRIDEPAASHYPTTTDTFHATPFTTPQGVGRMQESVFEKVPPHGGPVSYLGTGTFSQFEHCLHECLERERLRTGVSSHITRHDYPPNISVHDYGYDARPTSVLPPISSYNHDARPTSVVPPLSSYHHDAIHNPALPRISSYDYDAIHDPVLPPISSYHHDAIHNPVLPRISSYDYDGYFSRPSAAFSLDDIRQINVALSRSGIPLFPYYGHYDRAYSPPMSLPVMTADPPPMSLPVMTTDPPPMSLPVMTADPPYPYRRRIIGEIVSACRIVDEDPALIYNQSRSQAVQNVWNAVRNHQPFSYVDPTRSHIISRGPYDV